MYPINELGKMHIEELHRRAAKQRFAAQVERDMEGDNARRLARLFTRRKRAGTRRRVILGWARAWRLVRRPSPRELAD
ncbi:MAG: hypothetical protein ACXVQY_11365 [Actinomycetota bacterium]